MHYIRKLGIELPERQSAFLWGPRQTGKSTLLKELFPDSISIDLLDSNVRGPLLLEPGSLFERLRADPEFHPNKPILIDEIQAVPELLNEVHRLIEDEGLSFVMCASSARKLVRGRANLLGGRAWRFNLHPLTYGEIPSFDLLTALNRGLLPRHYQSSNYQRLLSAYADDYLKQEVFAEGLTRNIPAFARFFDSMGFNHGEQLNFSNIGRDVGIDPKTVRENFQILVDTLLGSYLEPFRVKRSRAIITKAPEFYLFDVGVAGYLSGRSLVKNRGAEFGKALEHFIFMELNAFRSYNELSYPIRYWRTQSGLECDFVIGRLGQTVIEVKGSRRIDQRDLRSLRAFMDEYSPHQAILVTNEGAARKTSDGILILPWREFLERMWSEELILE